MRPFVERVVSFLTLLLAAFAMAQLAGAQTLPDSLAQQDDQVGEILLHRSSVARDGLFDHQPTARLAAAGVAGGP